MKVVSWNVNGLRSAYKQGFLKWFGKIKADIVCLQEIKSDKYQLPKELQEPPGYYAIFNSASKKGYSGVVIYTKEKPLKVQFQLGVDKFDKEGRFIHVKYLRFQLINIYMPHGGRNKENLPYKLKAYVALIERIKRLKNQNTVLIGDFNVAHKEIDLARPSQNKKNIMFTAQERRQLDKIIKLRFHDTFRLKNKKSGFYTWWPHAFNARQRNLGWRIDYVFVSDSLRPKVKRVFIQSEVLGSDHCPVGMLMTKINK